MRSPALLAWGLFVHKLFAAGVLLFAAGAGARPSLIALSFVCGFVGDALLVLAFVALSAVARRPFLSRAVHALAWLLALASVLNVLLVATFGSPLAASMLAYAGDARAAAAAVGPLLLTAAALGVFGGGAWVLSRRVRPLRARALVTTALGLAALGAVSHALDTDDRMLALGLHRAPPVFFAQSLLPAASTPPARVRWDTATAPPVTEALVERTQTPRHVVVWLAESTGRRHVSLFGAPAERTPRLEALREHALVFEDAYAPSPVSAKAIFSVLCGLYPLPDAQFEARRFPRIACASLPEVLGAHGFSSALLHGGYFAFTDKRALFEERGFSVLLDGENMPERDRWWTNGWGIDDRALVQQQLAWVDDELARDPQARTLSILIPLLPHYEYFLPPGAPTPFGSATLRDRHANGVAYDDALFGELIDGFKKRALFDDTLFVFLGDHGEAFDEHPNNKIHGSFLYDENVRTPLVFIQSRLFPAHRRSQVTASHPDVMPTILDLLDLPIPEPLAGRVQGRSLVSGTVTSRAVPLMTFYPATLAGLVDGPYKYVRDAGSGREELYDRARDPAEQRNLARLLPEQTAAMRARALDFFDRQPDALAAIPQLGPGYLDRFVAGAQVLVRKDGKDVACPRVQPQTVGDRFDCGGGAWVGIAVERSFNMERRCLVVHAVDGGSLVLQGSTTPPPRTVGVGLTDASRRKGGTPLLARFTVGASTDVRLEVNDTFETTSRMQTLPRSGAASAAVTITIDSERALHRAACVTLSP